jgi:hypothetical protein
MKIIEGWVVWDAENYCKDGNNIYPNKEYAIEAASKHYSYLGEEVDEGCVRKVKLNLWFAFSDIVSLIEDKWKIDCDLPNYHRTWRQ